MSAPKRWLDEAGSATGVERDVLRAGLAIDPPPGAKAEVWTTLLGQLPPGPLGGGGGGGHGAAGGKGAAAAGKSATAAKAAAGAGSAAKGAAVAAAGGGLLKSALIGAGSAVALLATYSAVVPDKPRSEPPPAPAEAAPLAPVHADKRAAAPGPSPAPELTASPTASPAPSGASSAAPEARPAYVLPGPGAAAPPEGAKDVAPDRDPSAPAGLAASDRESRLREESQRVTEARNTLRSGDAAGALAQLEELRRAFPGGILVQEREALTIEALAKSGRRSDASARAKAFLEAYPSSPHATRVEAFTH